MDCLCWDIFTTTLWCLPYLHLLLLLSVWFGRIKWDSTAKIPGPRSVPIICDISLLRLHSRPFSKLLSLRQRYGSTFRMWFGRTAYVFVTDPDVIEKIYSKYNVRNRAESVAKSVRPVLLEGLLVAKNENWRMSRKVVVSTLHKNALNQSIENFVKNSNILVNRLLKYAKDSDVDIRRYFTQFAIDVLSETMFGMEANAQINDDWNLIQNIWKCFSIIGKRNVRPWLYMDSVFKMSALGKRYQCTLAKVHTELRNIIQKRHKAIQEDLKADEGVIINQEYVKCIDLLLTKNNKSEDEVLGECTNLFAAGVSTVAMTCSYALVFLAENHQFQDKVIQEQLDIFGKDDFRRPVTAEDLPQMTYLEQVIKETLRLCPAIPFTFRQPDQDLDIGSGMTIPANATVVISHYFVQRDEKHFPDPLKFNPDNFDPNMDWKRHPYSYTPFGGGRRLCLCQNMAMLEMKAALSTVLRNLRITDTVHRMTDMEKYFVLGIDLRSTLEILIKLSPRN